MWWSMGTSPECVLLFAGCELSVETTAASWVGTFCDPQFHSIRFRFTISDDWKKEWGSPFSLKGKLLAPVHRVLLIVFKGNVKLSNCFLLFWFQIKMVQLGSTRAKVSRYMQLKKKRSIIQMFVVLFKAAQEKGTPTTVSFVPGSFLEPEGV